MKSSIRVNFDDAELLKKIGDMAADAEISRNALVVWILAAQFSDKDRKSLKLLEEMIAIKKIS